MENKNKNKKKEQSLFDDNYDYISFCAKTWLAGVALVPVISILSVIFKGLTALLK